MFFKENRRIFPARITKNNQNLGQIEVIFRSGVKYDSDEKILITNLINKYTVQKIIYITLNI